MTEATATGPKWPYHKIPNCPNLYRHNKTGNYCAVKKVNGRHKQHSLGTTDRKIAERLLRHWVSTLEKVNTEVGRTTFRQLVERSRAANQGKSKSTRCTEACIARQLERTWPYGMHIEVRNIRPSQLDEWLAIHEGRLKNTSYNRYALFLKQLFALAVKDRIISESPMKEVKRPWKKPQTPVRIVPTVEQFQSIVNCVRAQPFTDHAQDSANFIEFLGLAGLGQAEASSLTWGKVDWKQGRLHVRRHKTDSYFYVPIYPHLRPLLERLKAEAGKVEPETRVFKIKDAKKALKTACVTLGLPLFSQRNIRQCLILRLWRAGIDKKLIAKFQGHQDGGQLIMETYTQVFGSDDDEYERQQLAKLCA